MQTPYGARRVGSVSKLSTIRDGFRILGTIGRLMRDERPLLFFGAISGVIMLTALALGAPVIGEYMQTGLVPRFPTAFLCGTLAVLACISLVSGIILETVSLGRREMKRLAYNGIESLTAKLERFEETRLTLTSLRAQALQENPAQSSRMPRLASRSIIAICSAALICSVLVIGSTSAEAASPAAAPLSATHPEAVPAAKSDINFELDVMPILTVAGCNGGPCHGKSRGQNGFQLSLLGFDADFDFNAT